MWRLACRNFCCGLTDSLRGCYKILLLDRPSAGSAVSSSQGTSSGISAGSSSSSGQPVRTTLALRRAELKSKQSETSSHRSDEKPKALYRLFQCIFLNLVCILLFHYLLIPLIEYLVHKCFDLIINNVGGDYVRTNSEYFSSFFTNLLNALWVLPIFIITRIVNALWFQDIANAALRRRGKSGVQLSFSRSVADFCYAILLEAVFLVQTYFVGLLPVPYVNLALKIVHTGLLYGLYSFEYVWMSQGLEMHQRLNRIEQNYPYYFGFGLPLTLITMSPSTVFLSGCVFGLCFPVFIVASFEARPPSEVDWEPIKFFWPSVCICDRVSMTILHKARAQISHPRTFE